MLVICEGYKICMDGCEECYHISPHEAQYRDFEDDNGNMIASCNGICCAKFPYQCTHKSYNSYIIYMRKEKLKKIEDVSNL